MKDLKERAIKATKLFLERRGAGVVPLAGVAA